MTTTPGDAAPRREGRPAVDATTTGLWDGEVVRLRAVERPDADAFVGWAHDPRVQPFLTGLSLPLSRLDGEQWIQRQRERPPTSFDFDFVVCLRRTNAVVGALTVSESDLRNGVFSLSLAIHPEHHRQGIGRDAMLILLRSYFRGFRFHKAHAGALRFNEGSAALLQSLGFVREGVRREVLYWDGAWHDEILFGMTSAEFDASHGARLQFISNLP